MNLKIRVDQLEENQKNLLVECHALKTESSDLATQSSQLPVPHELVTVPKFPLAKLSAALWKGRMQLLGARWRLRARISRFKKIKLILQIWNVLSRVSQLLEVLRWKPRKTSESVTPRKENE